MSRRRKDGPTPKRDSRRSVWGSAGPTPPAQPAAGGHDCAICAALAAGDTDAALAAFFAGDVEYQADPD